MLWFVISRLRVVWIYMSFNISRSLSSFAHGLVRERESEVESLSFCNFSACIFNRTMITTERDAHETQFA
jgi:hypothetical protein